MDRHHSILTKFEYDSCLCLTLFVKNSCNDVRKRISYCAVNNPFVVPGIIQSKTTDAVECPMKPKQSGPWAPIEPREFFFCQFLSFF